MRVNGGMAPAGTAPAAATTAAAGMAFRISRRDVVMVSSGSLGPTDSILGALRVYAFARPGGLPHVRSRPENASARRSPTTSRTGCPSTSAAPRSRASPPGRRRRLRAHLGLPEAPARVSDRVQQLDHVEEDLLRALEVDTRGLWPWNARNAPVQETDDGEHRSHVDEWGLTYRIPREGALWYDLAASPLAGGALTRERIDAHPWPRGDDLRQLAGASRRRPRPIARPGTPSS